MAQATILASAQTAGTSTDVVVAAGSNASVGLFCTGTLPAGGRLATLKMDTPGDDIAVAELSAAYPVHVISGPGTYRVVRENIAHKGVNVGVFSES